MAIMLSDEMFSKSSSVSGVPASGKMRSKESFASSAAIKILCLSIIDVLKNVNENARRD